MFFIVSEDDFFFLKITIDGADYLQFTFYFIIDNYNT